MMKNYKEGDDLTEKLRSLFKSEEFKMMMEKRQMVEVRR